MSAEEWPPILRGHPVRRVRVLWEPRDVWVGVYWDRPMPIDMGYGFALRTILLYVCLVPCFPLKVTLSRVKPDKVNARAQGR